MHHCGAAIVGLCAAASASQLPLVDLKPYAGVYGGEIWSSGAAAPAVTTLQVGPDQALGGIYVFEEADGQTTAGKLDECRVQGQSATCRWQDRYGDGRLNMRFNAEFCSFRGQWSMSSTPDVQAFWNGRRHDKDCNAAVARADPILR